MNLNALHNIMNTALVVVGGLELFSWGDLFGPELAVQIMAGIGAFKLVANALRDGIGGLVKVQPPVE
jgi:hypothetical protein